MQNFFIKLNDITIAYMDDKLMFSPTLILTDEEHRYLMSKMNEIFTDHRDDILIISVSQQIDKELGTLTEDGKEMLALYFEKTPIKLIYDPKDTKVCNIFAKISNTISIICGDLS